MAQRNNLLSTPQKGKPCLPVDIYRAIKRAHSAKRISTDDLKVVTNYGVLGRRPRQGTEHDDYITFRNVMDVIEGDLIKLGIVEEQQNDRRLH